MLEPTDLVVAKTLIRVLGVLAVLAKDDNLEAASFIEDALAIVIKNNQAVGERINQLTDEVTQEILAEVEGTAVSNLDREPRTGAGSLD